MRITIDFSQGLPTITADSEHLAKRLQASVKILQGWRSENSCENDLVEGEEDEDFLGEHHACRQNDQQSINLRQDCSSQGSASSHRRCL